jgi:BirA family transcriptional regulator, biotin operon repressor / biotin---[acetyl-CoA-carboxylase] ligase
VGVLRASLGRPRRHYRSTESTNERARELAEAGAPSGTVVTAAEQTAGRGRRGRSWSAPAGKALLYSAILRPLDERHRLLPLAVPVAVCDAVESLTPVSCRVKWPNDVWIEERKVAGILIEARPPRWAVIGIGLNVSIEPDEFPADARWPATSVGQDVGVPAALAAVNAGLGEWLEAPPERVLARYAERDALRARAVTWQGGPSGSERGRGRAEGIDGAGNLIVEAEDGARLSLGAGEVQLTLD